MFRIADNTAWVVSNNFISRYEFGDQTIEKGTFDNDAKITSIHLTETFGKTNILSLIGSGDNKIKLVSGNDLLASVNVSSVPTYMNTYKKSNHDLSENFILFGTLSGSLGLIAIEKNKEKSDKVAVNSLFESIKGKLIDNKSF